MEKIHRISWRKPANGGQEDWSGYYKLWLGGDEAWYGSCFGKVSPSLSHAKVARDWCKKQTAFDWEKSATNPEWVDVAHDEDGNLYQATYSRTEDEDGVVLERWRVMFLGEAGQWTLIGTNREELAWECREMFRLETRRRAMRKKLDDV